MTQVGVQRRDVTREVFVLWLVTLIAVRGVVELVTRVGLHEVFLALVPILFMYTPVFQCWLRGVDSYDYPLHLPALRDRATWTTALGLNAVAIGVVTIPLLVGYHLWQTTAFGLENLWIWPESFVMLIGYHLFFVAIPEEMFYRGYVQTRLDEAWRPRWNIFGARLGPGWLMTCVIFAIGHDVVDYQWWHVLIFFPSLAFGWMRARTGGIIAGALFHAYCNVTVTTLDTLYGVIPPS